MELARLRGRHEAGVLAYFMRRTRSAPLSWDLAAETWASVELAGRRARGGEVPPEWLFAVARDTLCAALRAGRVPDRARTKAGAPSAPLTAERARWVEDVATEDELAALVAGLHPALRQAVMAPTSASEAAALAGRVRPARPRSAATRGNRRLTPLLTRLRVVR